MSVSPSAAYFSFSDSDSGSGTTTPSSIEFSTPTHCFLPPQCADPTFLKDFASTLERGAGDKIVLSLQNCGLHQSSGDMKAVISHAIITLAKAVAGGSDEAFTLDKRWSKISRELEGKIFSYFTDSASSMCEDQAALDEVASAHDFKAQEYTPAEALCLFSLSSFRSIYSVTTSCGGYTLHCLERPRVSFPPLLPPDGSSTPFGVPMTSEWRDLWAAWDLVTLGMIPQHMLHQKPIDLRHKCLFYIGHIPTFLDMLLSKALQEPNTEPKNFTVIFERGIDPHVDDPDHCHSHSEVPEADEDWPTLTTILSFRDRVRARLMRLYDDIKSGKRIINRHIARMLVMTLEHEGFHVETLLYMLIQRAGTGTLPPPGFTIPPWAALSEHWNNSLRPLSAPTVTLGPTTVVLGHDDSEGDDLISGISESVDGHEFGWDNESPARTFEVEQFKIDWRPVTNGEFHDFWKTSGLVKMPTSWVQEDENIKVRTLYGPVPMAVAQYWPVLTSYDDLLIYAQSKGGRLPTEPELRLFLDKYEVGHDGGANVGFRNWHPVPPTTGCEEFGGRGSNGGVWEWTSTLFDGHDGLVPTKHFPGYSTDFFDTKHQIVLGASYATIPRIAGRRTVRNFYQRNYPYPWVSARVAYDL